MSVFGGTIRGMGGYGIRGGRNAHFERLHLNNNGGTAIVVGEDSLVSDCTADLNGGFGIYANNGSLIRRSIFAYNLNGGYFNEPDPMGDRVAIGENVFRFNLYQPWLGNPVHLQPSACFGLQCP